ncbi:MAG: molybdopterin biosynthesis protein [Halobacteriota archaeon]|nr:molybdopterin biosynthesis protein [Halobacteriota archaeon]
MERREFLDVVSFKEAERIIGAIDIVSVEEEVRLAEVLGRVISKDLVSKIDVPSFDRASMDGYAVVAEDTFYVDDQNPVRLRFVGEIRAGDDSDLTVKRGTCVGIATGAPIPYGANAVVMVEYTGDEDSEIEIYRPVAPGENIMAAGSDIMRGETIMRRGTRLTPRETGVLAASGFKTVPAFKRPRVAIISTGNEIIEPGTELEYAKIYDVNARAVADYIRELGGEPIYAGIVKDDFDEIYRKLKACLSRDYDIVITSGGTSAGVGDILYKIIAELGEVLVHGVAIKPGKPVLIGVCMGKPVFGLPGYPTSALVVFNTFVAPLIRKIQGLPKTTEDRKKVFAKTAVKLFSAKGRYEYLLVNVIPLFDSLVVYPILSGSGAITTLANADGYVRVPENVEMVAEGEVVEVELATETLKPADLCIIGSHCLGIDLLVGILSEDQAIASKMINVGSTGGLAAIRRGEADLSGMHLLDEKTGEYNIPFFRDLANEALLFRGYKRRQGLIVACENPLGIESIEDLLSEGVRFINRNRGSGTRILLDLELNRLSSKRNAGFDELIKSIQGYGIEAKSHNAIAAAVAYGKADVGLGIEAVANLYDLSFIPVKDEIYDIAVPLQKIEKREVQIFLETLRSDEFRDRLEGIVGLEALDDTGEELHF